MFILLTCFLLSVLALNWRRGGPISVLAVAWLIATVPIALRLITFRYFTAVDLIYELRVIGFLVCFISGALLSRYLSPSSFSRRTRTILREPLAHALPLATACWWLGLFATVCLWLDWITRGGAGLTNLAALRAEVTLRTATSSIFLQLSTVTGWASLYCFIFLLAYSKEITRLRFVLYLLPTAGFFLGALLSAGRQAAFQLLLVSLLVYFYSPSRNNAKCASSHAPRGDFGLLAGETLRGPTHKLKTRGNLLFAGFLCSVLVCYMGYVAVARNDNHISTDHSSVLRYLFKYDVSPVLLVVENAVNNSVKQLIEESLIYFSAPLPLFRSFLTLERPHFYFGVFSFPFAFRQVESITHISVIGALYDKMGTMGKSG